MLVFALFFYFSFFCCELEVCGIFGGNTFANWEVDWTCLGGLVAVAGACFKVLED